jgi:potassium-transporting ATPase potassium-binding subunit
MSSSALVQYAAFLLAVTLLVKPVGRYMAGVFTGESTLLDPLFCPLERLIYRLTGVRPKSEMRWQEYAQAFVLFGLTGTLALYAILGLQRLLPWFYPAYMTTPMTPDLAMNMAVSFSTTSTWQAYGGETTLSYFSQIVGLTVQNFLAGSRSGSGRCFHPRAGA